MKHFKQSVLFIVALILASSPVLSAKYDIDLAHSAVEFKVRHLVSKTKGRFDNFSGIIEYKKDKLKNLEAKVKINTKSVNTNNEKRDDHLRNPDFFNTEKYPEMTFKSTKVKPTGKSTFKMTGDLTLLGVTKPVTLEGEFLGETVGPWGNTRIGFSASGKLDRKDFGMEFNITDKGGLVIGNDVEILIEVEAIKQEKEAKKTKK